jgi:nucleoside-diphosphate-sugar epimerase
MSPLASPRVLVTGGAGYVGAVLVPRLLARGHQVRVLDLYLYGHDALRCVRGHRHLEEVAADIRDAAAVRQAMSGIDAVIHLACISNDPSCALDPALTHSINYAAFDPLVRLAREAGVQRFIFASSASVYGVSEAPRVSEEHPLRPITLYNRYKGACEAILFAHDAPGFTTVAVRPATICGCSPRPRLDLTVNLLTTQAVERGAITVFGGTQKRPHLHMRDMIRIYERLLDAPARCIAGHAFNAGYENCTVADLATAVRDVAAAELPERPPVRIETLPSDDPRSYHVCSDKIGAHLGFVPAHTTRDAVRELIAALRAGSLPGALSDPRYYNVQLMQQVGLR